MKILKFYFKNGFKHISLINKKLLSDNKMVILFKLGIFYVGLGGIFKALTRRGGSKKMLFTYPPPPPRLILEQSLLKSRILESNCFAFWHSRYSALIYENHRNIKKLVGKWKLLLPEYYCKQKLTCKYACSLCEQ